MKPQSYKLIVFTHGDAEPIGPNLNVTVEQWASQGYLIVNHIVAGVRMIIIMAKDRPE